MKKIFNIIVGIFFLINSYGQDFSVEIKIDTLKKIQTKNIQTKEIEFEIPHGRVYISKKPLIEVWQNHLASWEDKIKNNSKNTNWEIENYKESESYLKFVENQDKIFFDYDNTNHDSISQISQIEDLPSKTDTLYYIENQLKEFVCSLLDKGDFEVQINNKKVDSVIKARVRETTKYFETISTKYIVNDSIFFWVCPPLIRADFAIDPENMYVPEPPKN